MILINVLLFVAIASSALMLMISGEDAALHSALRMREAERAQAIARGGELSALAALRRDAVEGPETDNVTEPWAAVAQNEVPIDGGTFSLEIADAQTRINVNDVRDGTAQPVETLQRVGAAAGMTPEAVARAIELIRLYGPVTDLQALAAAAPDPASAARAAPLLTALPYRAPINVNAASEAMLAFLLSNPPLARQLVQRRARNGFLTSKDFQETGASLPSNAGFTSRLFWVRTRVVIGGTSQTLTSLIARRRDPLGRPIVSVVARWQGRNSPYDLLADPLPIRTR